MRRYSGSGLHSFLVLWIIGLIHHELQMNCWVWLGLQRFANIGILTSWEISQMAHMLKTVLIPLWCIIHLGSILWWNDPFMSYNKNRPCFTKPWKWSSSHLCHSIEVSNEELWWREYTVEKVSLKMVNVIASCANQYDIGAVSRYLYMRQSYLIRTDRLVFVCVQH